MSDDYLTTTPDTQVSITIPAWCTGHSWRDRRGLRWVHHVGHRLRLLRNQPPALLRYLESK